MKKINLLLFTLITFLCLDVINVNAETTCAEGEKLYNNKCYVVKTVCASSCDSTVIDDNFGDNIYLKLTENLTVTTAIAFDGNTNTIVDLNGKTITFNKDNGSIVTIVGNSNISFINGTILDNEIVNMSYSFIPYQNATLTLDNIIYTTNRSHTIWLDGAVNVNILNTKIKSTTGSSSHQTSSNILYEPTSTGKLTITNSRLISDNDALIRRNGGSTDPDSFTFEIKDSYFKNESIGGTSPYKILLLDKTLSEIIGENQVVSQTGTKVQTSVVADTITTDDGTELTIYTPATLEADTKTYDKYSLSADHTLVEIRTKLSPVGTYDGITEVKYNSIRLANGEVLYAEDDSAFALLYNYYNNLSIGSYVFDVVLASGLTRTFTLNVVDTTPTYNIANGSNQEFVINSNKDLIINIDGLNSLLNGVYVNNQLLSNNDYTVSGERTVLTINNNYLKSLGEGTYTLKVTYSNDEEASTTFKVVKSIENPQTSDKIMNSLLLGSISLMLILGCGLCLNKKKLTK